VRARCCVSRRLGFVMVTMTVKIGLMNDAAVSVRLLFSLLFSQTLISRYWLISIHLLC